MNSRGLIDRRSTRLVVGALAFAAALTVWQVVGEAGSVAFLVPFSDAATAMWDLLSGDGLREDVLPSAARALAGFGLGAAVGIAAGLLLGYFRRLDPWVRPLLEFMRATPIPAILPVAILALGATSATRVFLIALGCLWPVLLSALDGSRAVDPRNIEAARVAGLSDGQILRRVVWPASLPAIFTGLRLGLALSLIMMVISEMIASNSGLGYFILQAQRSFAMPDMFGGVLVLGLLGGAFTLVFTLVERRVLGWYLQQKGLHDA